MNCQATDGDIWRLRPVLLLFVVVQLCSSLPTSTITLWQKTNNTQAPTAEEVTSQLSIESINQWNEVTSSSPSSVRPVDDNGHKLKCTKAELHAAGCGNRGQCYVLETGRRRPFCLCNSGWEGYRCLIKPLPVSAGDAGFVVPAITGAVIVAVIVGVAAGFCIWCTVRRVSRQQKEKEERKKLNGQQDA
jgi:hypothetical protein